MRICFIVAPQNKSTILDRIAHEIGKGFEDSIYFYDFDNNSPNDFTLPKADHYFLTHYVMLPRVMEKVNPQITPITCFFTHNKGHIESYVDVLNLCHSVIAENPEGEELLSSLGVNKSLLHFVPECGDNVAFKPHQRQADGAVLVCGTNYDDGRKNPELVKSVVSLLPNKKWLFVGKGWQDCKELPYELYPQAYSECSVYLSCSKLEGGGPNSLIEAMHANLIPVVSDTGNAREYIKHGYNGFIFPLDATAEYVASLIERAYKFKPQDEPPFIDVWQSVLPFTWENYSLQMKEIITGNYAETTSQGNYAFKP